MTLNLGPELRQTVWYLKDWSSSVPELGKSLVANHEIGQLEKSALLLQTAQLCEFCVLDPQAAADFYSASYQANRSQFDILPRMRELCHKMGRSDHAARTAELEFRHSKVPGFHAIAGQAWLDAGQPDRALKPLLRALEDIPCTPEIAAALEVARRDWANPEVHANSLLDEARGRTPGYHIKALQSSRIFRMLDIEDDRYEEGLRLCLSHDPNMPSPCNLMEHFLFTSDRLDELADHFRRRAKAAPDDRTAAQLLFDGSSILFRAKAGDAGGPLFVDALHEAVKAKLPTIPGLLAQLRGLVACAAAQRKQVVDLAEQAYSILKSQDEQVGVAVFISQITKHAKKDKAETKIWIKRLKENCANHPLIQELGTA